MQQEVQKNTITQLPNEQEILNLPKEIQETFYHLKNKKTSMLPPEKYYDAQKQLIEVSLYERSKKEPFLGVKGVVIEIIQNLPDFVPGHKILEITEHTINIWEKYYQKTSINQEIAIA